MTVVTENGIGIVTLEDEVIAKIAGIATTDCYGIVGMATKNMKDGIVRLLKIDSITKGVKVEIKNNNLTLDLHIIVKYGINIKAVADMIISTVKYKVEDMSGLKVSHINIFVEGIKVND